MIKFAQEFRWTLIFGILTGVLLSPLSVVIMERMTAWYDKTFPIVEMQGEIVDRTEDIVHIHVWGKKNRDCRYLGIQALTLKDGSMRDAFAVRADMLEAKMTKPKGVFDIGLWRVWPLVGAESILMFVQHDCSGRIVVTKIAEVRL